jgi:hypothetical protein
VDTFNPTVILTPHPQAVVRMMDINSSRVQGLIARIVTAAESGYLSGMRLEIRNHEGMVETLLTDSTMMRSHTDPSPMTEAEGARYLADSRCAILPRA